MGEQRKADIEDKFELEMMCRDIIDADGNGNISKLELAELLRQDAVKAYFAARGLDVTDAEMFFNMICHKAGKVINEHAEVPIKQFVEFCISLKGQATSLDLHILEHDVLLRHREIVDLLTKITVMNQNLRR